MTPPTKHDISLAEVKKVLKGVTIPPRPSISLEINKVYPDVEKIADIVSRDPGIASALLRTINSPYYGLKYEVKGIKQAAMYLGTDSVINITNAVLVKSTLSSELDQVFMERFWDCTSDTAVAMAALTQFLGLTSLTDEAYTVGLFHDCGIPLLMLKYNNYTKVLAEAYKNSDQDIMQVESGHFGCSHAVVGFYVCKTWGLAESMSGAILEHHNRTEIPVLMQEMSDRNTLLGLLKMAENISLEYELLGTTQVDHDWEYVKSSIFEYFELSEDDYLDLQEQIVEQVDADQAQRVKV